MQTQIVLLHAHNTFNNGSFMMLINFIWYYMLNVEEDSKTTFWIELDGEENLHRLRQAIPDDCYSSNQFSIKPLPLKITSADNSVFILKLIRLYQKLFTHPRIFRKLGIESIIILGGDDISEYYKRWMIISDIFRIACYSKKFPTYLSGQTIGPFAKSRKLFARKGLRKTKIFTRDPLTTTYLKDDLQLPKENIIESADLCFPDLPELSQTKSILDRYDLNSNKYICVVPGGFYRLYTKDSNAYIKAWKKVIEQLLSVPELEQKKIVLLPHVTRPEDDRELGELLSQIIDMPSRLYVIKDELLPQQLRSILGNGFFTLSSRMHAALSTFQMRRPAIALGHSVKYDGVIGRSIKCPELIIPCSAELISDVDNFISEISKKVNYILQYHNEICARLEERIPQLQKLAINQINSIAEHINATSKK